jgi:hypothetical protein
MAERQKRVEDDGNPYEQYMGPSNKVPSGVKLSGKRTIIKTSLPSSNKNVAMSAANIKRAPQSQNQSDTKVTILKRKTITGNSKR